MFVTVLELQDMMVSQGRVLVVRGDLGIFSEQHGLGWSALACRINVYNGTSINRRTSSNSHANHF